MPNLFLEFSYRGSGYAGSQVQPNVVTVQELLNKKIEQMFGQRVNSIFAGRTDSGVHALGQCLNVQVAKKIAAENVRQGLNSLLPEDICIRRAEYLSDDFHARYSAIAREYVYNIYVGKTVPIHLQDFVWFLEDEQLNFKQLKKAASLVKGERDFSTFCAAGSSTKSKLCQVWNSSIVVKNAEIYPGTIGNQGKLITYKVKANRFLYRMVRNIVGALIDVANNRLTLEKLKASIINGDRRKLKSITAPAKGLILKKVYYKKGKK